MRQILRVGGAAAAAALSMVLLATPAAADAVVASPCGVVTAFTAPTATAAGSVTIGGTTFTLAAGAQVPGGGDPARAFVVGPAQCIAGQLNAAGAFTTFVSSPMGSTFCGTVLSFTPATATAAGSITLQNGPNAAMSLPVAAGTTLQTSQVTGANCFTIAANAQGVGQITGFQGAQGGTTAPAAPAAPRQLPSTSTSGETDLAIGLVIAGLALTSIATARPAVSRGHTA